MEREAEEVPRLTLSRNLSWLNRGLAPKGRAALAEGYRPGRRRQR